MASIEACCQLCVSDLQCTGWVWDTIANDPSTGKVNCWVVASYVTEPSIAQRVFGSVGRAAAAAPAAYQWPATKGALHQVGKTYLTSMLVDGDDWSQQPLYTAHWGFRAPTSGAYRFSTSHVASTGGVTGVQLTNRAPFCLREKAAGTATASGCIGKGVVPTPGNARHPNPSILPPVFGSLCDDSFLGVGRPTRRERWLDLNRGWGAAEGGHALRDGPDLRLAPGWVCSGGRDLD